jgi:hypothetical protein
MKSVVASGLMLAAVIGLSACSGAAGGGDLSGRLTAVCVKERGEAERTACECASRVVDEALNDQDRKLALFSIDAEEGRFKTREEARAAFGALGLDVENAEQITGEFVMRMMTVEAAASARCGAPARSK